MRFIGFPHEISYPSAVHNVWVNLRFPQARTPTVIKALLDTGSGITVLNRKHAKHLRVPDITSSSEVIELVLADGGRAQGYIHKMPVEFLGRQLSIDVAFVPAMDTADLIGMRGFFDQMTVAFDHAQRKAYVAFN